MQNSTNAVLPRPRKVFVLVENICVLAGLYETGVSIEIMSACLLDFFWFAHGVGWLVARGSNPRRG